MMPFLNSWTCIVAHCVHWSWCWSSIRSICDAANPVKVSDINPLPANVENMVSSENASRWQMGFNLAFKGLIKLSTGKEHESPW